MKTARSLSHAPAFTLIEVVISAALMALILTAAYLCLSAGIAGKKLVEPRADIIQNARVAMALLTADLRAACPLSKDYAFLGLQRKIGETEADNMDFATHNYTPRRPHEGDFCQESFYLDKDPLTGQFGLWRRRNPVFAPDPLAGGKKEAIAQGLLGARFEYSNGTDWFDNWGEIKGKSKAENSNRDQPNLAGMPKAVRITLMFDSNPKTKPAMAGAEVATEPPLIFQSVARLNLASRTADDASGAGDNSGGQPAAGGGMN
ncbi:MAG: prepilin-type N-terminal cleavage/methylation domain-containing protein [Verrucomicrobiota bacterium]